jgi:hypothetical protein
MGLFLLLQSVAYLEAGASHFVYGGVPFPEPLAVAAADDAELAYTLAYGDHGEHPVAPGAV